MIHDKMLLSSLKSKQFVHHDKENGLHASPKSTLSLSKGAGLAQAAPFDRLRAGSFDGSTELAKVRLRMLR
jgi:hypothetical protein